MTSNNNLPAIYDFNFKNNFSDKKWLNKDLDITDYFNYGFNEEIWTCYTNKVIKLYQLHKPDDYYQNMS